MKKILIGMLVGCVMSVVFGINVVYVEDLFYYKSEIVKVSV